MAHHVEPMDIDSDFDNKENSLHHNNVLPFTEKGYEELDVSELNMKLRYSVTPASSPMSKSYTANCTDNRSLESGDDSLNVTVNENFNLSNSLNSTLTKNDNIIKSLKGLPLQAIPTEQFVDSNRNTSVLRSIDSAAVTPNNNDITVTVSGPSDIDENLSLPSSSSSALHTPEATTPTKDIPLKDGGSPIMRGLKSVLNMFRSSQSPIPPADNEGIAKPEMLSPAEVPLPDQENKSQAVLASTPIASHRKKEMSPTKRSSPSKDSSIVFNDDLEKELQWKDETTIIFSQERIPIHKLMLQQPQDSKTFGKDMTDNAKVDTQGLNSTVEYMDISYNDSFSDRTMTEIQVDNAKADATFGGESDSEFVDCETTFSKNKSTIEGNDNTPIGDLTQDLNLTKETQNKNDSGSRLKQIVLDTTQDILDATLSVRPEDLLPEIFDQTKNVSELVSNKTETIDTSRKLPVSKDVQESSQEVYQSNLNHTVDISNPLVLEAKDNDSENLNGTKTIEFTQPINETFDVASALTQEKREIEKLNATKVIENILGVTQILENSESNDIVDNKAVEAITAVEPSDQTFVATRSLAEDDNQTENLNVNKTQENILGMTQIIDNGALENLDCTKTIEVITTTQTINQTFDTATASSLIIEGNLNITKTEEIMLDVTQTLENQLGISENINAQMSKVPVVESKNVDSEQISIFDDVNSTNNELNTLNPALVEAVIKPLPIPDNLSEPVQDVTMTELPVDIPLPDEDDLDKELNLPTVISSEGNLLTSLPLDLVDDIKIIANVNENIIHATEPNFIQNPNNEDILPEICTPINTTNIEGGNHINNDLIANNLTETVKNDLKNAEIIEKNNEMSDICKEKENTALLPEVASVSYIAAEHTERVVDKEIEKSETKEINYETNLMVTENVEKTIETIKQDVIRNENVDPVDNNENSCEFKPLPDVINQTIALSNAENLNTNINIPETEPDKVTSSPANNDSNLPGKAIISALDIKEIEHQTTSPTDEEPVDPITETKMTQQKSVVNSSADAIATQDLSNSVPVSANITVSDQIGDSTDMSKTDVITTENELISTIEEVKSNIDNLQQAVEQTNSKDVEEEIVLSENNSPFVSVIADNIPETIQAQSNIAIENAEDTSKNKDKLTPPASPPIRSKGYNFNFDDIDFDPFATKTNIRMSPPLDSPNKITDPNAHEKYIEKPVTKKDINRRKSQPERKKPIAASKRKFNATFDAKMNDKVIEKPVQKLETKLSTDIQLDPPATVALSPQNITIEEKDDQKTEKPTETVNDNVPENVVQDEVEKPIEISTDASEKSLETNVNELKATSSSSDQSAYFSACTTSSESSIPSRNVFNLPEIDDVNFNPFATKSKMRQSPPPDIDNPFATRSKIISSPDSSVIALHRNEGNTIICDDKIETEPMEKDASGNLSDTSKATDDKNATTKEIHTEDEDTVEGPFLDSEDLNPDEKMSDFDGDNVDMLQYSEFPPQSNEENLDNGEMFIDAEAFEFLLNQNKSNTVADSGKESLFLKFDPLFAKRMSAVSTEGVLASLAKLQKKHSTPTKTAQTPPKNMPSPDAGPSNLNVTQDMDTNISEEFNDDLNITVSKPMMVVPPAVNPVTPRNKSLTPNRSNRRSITFTSPAMAVIDRLLSLSSNNSLIHDTTVTQVSREQNEADIALSQLRELLAEKEISVYNLKCESNELRDRLNTLEGHVKSLEAESEDRLKKINQLTDTLVEKTKINKSMAAVVEEYERTIASLIAETAQDKKKHAEERMKLINERDEQTAHLASMEVSFSDLHSKYEKSKQVILNCKANEEVYRKSIKEFEENLAKMHTNYELLKQHATSKLNHANQELEKINRTHEAEVLKLNAMIKRKELHITSLEESLAQKTKANDELTAICDELINKVG